jgi:hypothetical protein
LTNRFRTHASALRGAKHPDFLFQRASSLNIQGLSTMPTIEHPDFSVVVKNRGRLPAPWRWEIYRSGRNSPVKRSEAFFSTMTEADRAGKKALSLFLSEYYCC